MSSTASKNVSRAIAVTSGEPAGIGPDICLRLAEREWPARLVVLGDRDLLAARAAQLGLDPGRIDIRHVPLKKSAPAGRIDPANARYVLDMLDAALAGCLGGEYAAMVTAPVHKGVINDAGISFSGHTEYLAEHTATPRVVMLLAGAGLRVALATTHLALKDVPAAITRDDLETTLRILNADLKSKFGIGQPRILVAGLNPHAGEGGHMGREEIEVIGPVLAKLRAEGMDLVGPLPADTLFTKNVLAGSDAQLAMYHDQGLAVLKYAAFDEGINVTLGLPIIRTSVDHGTALDLAGTGKASPTSLFAAIDAAIDMAQRRTAPPAGPPQGRRSQNPEPAQPANHSHPLPRVRADHVPTARHERQHADRHLFFLRGLSHPRRAHRCAQGRLGHRLFRRARLPRLSRRRAVGAFGRGRTGAPLSDPFEERHRPHPQGDAGPHRAGEHPSLPARAVGPLLAFRP
jgi:4-hydroxythreonine-4-phosphate dehydrogenase